MGKKIKLLEIKSEIGAGTRGASMGIDALRIASLNHKSDFFNRYEEKEVRNQNHLLFEEIQTPSAIRIRGISQVYKDLSKAIVEILNEGNFPLVLAADHASAGGTIAGLKMHNPDKRIGVVWIDAHGDLHSPYTSPSGNVHGMPLATALNLDNKQAQIKEVEEAAILHWEEMKNLGGITPKILPEDLIFFGLRDTEEPENELIRRLGIKNFSVTECRTKGFDQAVQEALEKLSQCDFIYISFDVDSMDSDKVSEGTGTPVPNGFLPAEAQQIISGLIDSGKVDCFEMVEVNPTLDDKKNKMAETAFQILETTAKKIEQHIK